MDDDLDARIDELYALPLEQFIAARDALVKTLRADKRRDEAVRVAGLNKPAVAAWAVNQVVRTQARAAEALWAAGDAVLDVQDRVMAGDASGADLRAAVTAEREALATLAGAARGLVTGAGRFLGEVNVQAVTETLHAAAVDPSVRGEVAAGRSIRALQLSGLGTADATPRRTAERGPAKTARTATAAEPTPAPTAEPKPRTDAAARKLAERTRRDAAAEERERRAERDRKARRTEAQRALVRVERARDKAREAVAKAASKRDAAVERLEAARAELAAAEADVEHSESALAEVHEALERAEGEAEAARDAVEQA